MECEDVSLFGPLGTSLLIPKLTIESGGEIGDVSLFGPLGTNLFTPISANVIEDIKMFNCLDRLEPIFFENLSRHIKIRIKRILPRIANDNVRNKK